MVHGIIEYDLAFAKNVFINQERKLEVRRRSDTALVLTVNYANQRFAKVHLRLGEHLPGNQSVFGS
ncbi:conserved hypothetical protein, partial [Trichinella spiralis]|uniref:hypothetical protein n=1 Tax=Trichinella spiralis TaxID=6334 RepID=UPI0001EFEF92